MQAYKYISVKDRAIYEVSDLLVILVLRISERVSTKGPAAVGVAH